MKKFLREEKKAMYVKIRPEMNYVACVIPAYEMSIFLGKPMEEIETLIEEKMSDLVAVTRLPFGSITFCNYKKPYLVVQWIKMDDESRANLFMEISVEYCERNYKNWLSWPIA